MKILSIAVPCYNSEAYMEKCIDSLLVGDSLAMTVLGYKNTLPLTMELSLIHISEPTRP